MPDKQEQLTIYTKIIGYLTYVVMPVLLGNLVYWSHGVITGRNLPRKVRIAIIAGSMGMASGVHYACINWGWQKIEWLVIWFCSIFSEQLLRFLYVEVWDIAKDWMRDSAKRFISKTNK